MSFVSRCQPAAARPSALPPAAILQILLALAVALGFGLAHVRLRVQLTGVRRDISALQVDELRLKSDIFKTRTENAALKVPRNLQAFATRELGMVPYDATNGQAIAMPDDIRTRYALARGSGAGSIAERELADSNSSSAQPPLLANLGERIGLIGDAQADEPAR